VNFKGTDITNFSPDRIAKMGIGIVPQGRRVFKSLTVRENLTVVAKNRGQNWSLDRIYSLYPVLKARGNQKAGMLSGGEQQMLSTARAIRTEPDLLLMDEPSEGLAPLLVKELGQVLKQLKTGRLCILLVEQNFAYTLRVANSVNVMNKGKIVYKSTPEELQNNTEIKTRYLGI
jgi:branched-chain amino acid transport system ATP-binding protein